MSVKSTLVILLSIILLFACKKSKNGEETDSTPASISTIEMGSVKSAAVYGTDITFKIKFSGIGTGDKAVDQYGIVYKAWIANLTDKIPNNASSIIVFYDTPISGATIEKKVTLTYAQFNDANYRAFVRLKDGTYLYGEVKYFVSV